MFTGTMTGSRWKSSVWPIIIGYVTVTSLLQTPDFWRYFGAMICGFSSFWIDKLWLGLYDAKPQTKEEDDERQDPE